MRQHARKREDEFLAGGAQNFYKTVRVCGSCFRVSRFLFLGSTGFVFLLLSWATPFCLHAGGAHAIFPHALLFKRACSQTTALWPLFERVQ